LLYTSTLIQKTEHTTQLGTVDNCSSKWQENTLTASWVTCSCAARATKPSLSLFNSNDKSVHKTHELCAITETTNNLTSAYKNNVCTGFSQYLYKKAKKTII